MWTLATAAATTAFVLHLALRGVAVQRGYELGKARAEQARLREVKRVLELEAASYKTPDRVELVAKTMLGMEVPSADRIFVLRKGSSDRSSSSARSSATGGEALAQEHIP
jgi:cell division protein FtsL